jgi:DNA-binding NarL/FixJ family response regulator
MARSAVAETRRVVWNLRSTTVNLQEPRSVVAEEGAKLERRIGVKPEIASTGDERLLAPEVGAVIQRLLRVAFDNIWTHSAAKHVRVLLDFGLHVFTLIIEDDGKGFDPDDVDLLSAGRVGLAGIAERLRVVGGSLRIESAANHGTRVWGIVPYEPTAPVPKAKPVMPAPAATAATPAPNVSKRIRVVLIDDHSMVREGLEHMLSDQPDLQVIGAAATGSEGLRIINELHPEVVLCDLQLPDISGVEVISRVRTLFPDIRCIIVTTYDHDDFIYEGIKAGAKGYVLKDVSSTELAEAVRAAARNESLLQPVVAGKLLERFGEMARQGDMVEPLTEREIGVLRALATGSRNKEIALQLSLSESTIKTHLASIFGKLGVTTRTEAVTRGRELGLIPL